MLPAVRIAAPISIAQPLVASGCSPIVCIRLDSRLPAEKLIVPANAIARPIHVARSSTCPAICCQNRQPMPISPSSTPAIADCRSGRPMNSRPLIEFSSGAVENTTATRPLGTTCSA